MEGDGMSISVLGCARQPLGGTHGRLEFYPEEEPPNTNTKQAHAVLSCLSSSLSRNCDYSRPTERAVVGHPLAPGSGPVVGGGWASASPLSGPGAGGARMGAGAGGASGICRLPGGGWEQAGRSGVCGLLGGGGSGRQGRDSTGSQEGGGSGCTINGLPRSDQERVVRSGVRGLPGGGQEEAAQSGVRGLPGGAGRGRHGQASRLPGGGRDSACSREGARSGWRIHGLPRGGRERVVQSGICASVGSREVVGSGQHVGLPGGDRERAVRLGWPLRAPGSRPGGGGVVWRLRASGSRPGVGGMVGCPRAPRRGTGRDRVSVGFREEAGSGRASAGSQEGAGSGWCICHPRAPGRGPVWSGVWWLP
jgi:hypothetical protein